MRSPLSYLIPPTIAMAYASEIRRLKGHTLEESYQLPLPHTYIDPGDLPESFTWASVNGTSYLTHSLNQHLPQWCGSCWVHGALSALADRIKIARLAQGDDINLSIQYVLNCGGDVAGSCLGGSHLGAYQFIHQIGYVPYDTCMPYLACSSDVADGVCGQLDTTCKPDTTCRTCHPGNIRDSDGYCTEVPSFPNASVAEYGKLQHHVEMIKAEVLVRGPVSAAIYGPPLHTYHGGIYSNDTAPRHTTHVVSIVGWGVAEKDGVPYWHCRNSWGQFWGEMGFFRIELGKNMLGIESDIAWATPGHFAVVASSCFETGKSCDYRAEMYVDPSQRIHQLREWVRSIG